MESFNKLPALVKDWFFAEGIKRPNTNTDWGFGLGEKIVLSKPGA